MTDWRQIQARIRKAKNSPDAISKLSELFQRTRDGMVAWELGAIEEKSERTGEAVKWYTVAAERFRRAEWKRKAEEALARLGAPAPAAANRPGREYAGENNSAAADISDVAEEAESEIPKPSEEPFVYGEIAESDDAEIQMPAAASTSVASPPAVDADSATDPQKKKRRRGRRGGRGRRCKEPGASSLPKQAFAESAESQATPLATPLPFRQPEAVAQPLAFERPAPVMERPAPLPMRPVPVEAPPPQLPSERTAHGRAGDPALASRMAHLESMLRRLLSSPLRRLDDVEQAPAGPGVFLLSDSDQITSYYIEACQTLRVGLGNLLRGGRNAKNNRGGRNFPDTGLKNKLADHLGINESKVSQYMKDHCVVRWIQLDDEASHLAHFAIGILRTPLNLE